MCPVTWFIILWSKQNGGGPQPLLLGRTPVGRAHGWLGLALALRALKMGMKDGCPELTQVSLSVASSLFPTLVQAEG